jgi:DNA-binding NtrC family response regulator
LEIWLLDSNQSTGMSLALILQDWGFQVHHVARADQIDGLDFSVPPAVVVLDDEYLADEARWQAIERRIAHAWDAPPPIVLMSRRPNQSLKRTASTVLEKPVDLGRLRDLVTRLAEAA